MNEIALNSGMPNGKLRERIFGTRETRQSGAFYGYSASVIAISIGWLLRDRNLISPEHGVGYWLGIAGGSMMLALLLYPLRKRIRILSFLGKTAAWFRIHMMLGILGPLLVLFHSNFHLGSLNSRIALCCMLLVAGSGVVGRVLYARIHRGLYGRKTDLRELRNELTKSLEENRGIATLLPGLTARLDDLATQAQGDGLTGALSTGQSLKWTFRKYAAWMGLSVAARRELRALASTSPTVAKDYRRIKRSTASYIRRCVRLTGQVAQFTLYEKLFSLWHILHLPLFFMLVISAILHVVAVHMY